MVEGNASGVLSLRGCTRDNFEIAWTVSPGMGERSDMCYTPDGLLAVVRQGYHNVVLYGGNGQEVKESKSAGVSLKTPMGI